VLQEVEEFHYLSYIKLLESRELPCAFPLCTLHHGRVVCAVS